jgi:hypothetical protein
MRPPTGFQAQLRVDSADLEELDSSRPCSESRVVNTSSTPSYRVFCSSAASLIHILCEAEKLTPFSRLSPAISVLSVFDVREHHSQHVIAR